MTSDHSSDIMQFLTFELRGDAYGIDIQSIKEVLEIREITQLPRNEPFMRGVINLRGQVVPILDLKLKFGFEITEFTVDTCIIILELELADDEVTLLGVLADSVSEVIDLPAEEVSPPPKVGATVDSAFIYGVGKMDEEFIVILNVPKICSEEEMEVVQETSGELSD